MLEEKKKGAVQITFLAFLLKATIGMLPKETQIHLKKL